MDPSRPNTKGLISRTFRRSVITFRIINIDTEKLRTETLTILDKHDPLKSAEELVTRHMTTKEMILRKEVITDERIIVTMTPEEFVFRGTIIPYTSTSSQTEAES